jgi:hypothetical protein
MVARCLRQLVSTLRLTPSLVSTLRAYGSRFQLVVWEWGGKLGNPPFPPHRLLVYGRVRPQPYWLTSGGPKGRSVLNIRSEKGCVYQSDPQR